MITSTRPLSFVLPLKAKSCSEVNEGSDSDSDVTTAYAGTATMTASEMTASTASICIMITLFYLSL